MMLSNAGKIIDRNPDIIPAGKMFGLGDKADDCMKVSQKPSTPDQVQKFRCTTQPAAGKTRIFYGRYSDPDVASVLSHGLATKPSYMASQFISPEPQSYFQYRLNQKREESVYASQKRAPLGTSHDQKVGLPTGVGPYDQSYGLPTLRDHKAGELLNPDKSRCQVDEESQQGIDLYKKSHGEYAVGESYDRKYDWSRIPNSISFGVETPHENSGLHTKKSMKWMNETLGEKAAQLTSKRVDGFRERNTPQVGKVHDPIKDTLNTDPDHTHGIMVQPDDYGAGDLIHMRQSKSFLRGHDRIRGILAAVRQHLKKANYHNFADLKAAFTYYDKDKSGTIDLNELRGICLQFHLPVQKELLELLLECCDQNGDKKIDYIEFANFLNWKDKMPSGFQKKNDKSEDDQTEGDEYEEKIIAAVNSGLVDISQPDALRKQIDDSCDYTTSYSLLNGITRKDITKDKRPYGIPTIRSDLPAPRIRRMGDSSNYGDESDAYGLINPSIYSNVGIYEEDFFKSRDQGDIKRIFDSIGVEMTHEMFLELWSEAQTLSSDEHVSVESFRNILDEKIAQEYEKANAKDDPNDTYTLLQKTLRNKPKIYDQFHTNNNSNNKGVADTGAEKKVAFVC